MTVRRLLQADDLEALTRLVHAAYAPLAARGLRYWGTHQTVADTAKRCRAGETWLALLGRRMLGTITLVPPERACGSPWQDRPDVAKFGQFCVHPDAQGTGLGARLLDLVEARATALGAAHLACDTAEGALGLIELYRRRGYQRVETVDWRPRSNYLSVVLSLDLDERRVG